MVSLRKGQAVNLYIFIIQVVLWLLSVEKIGSTLTQGENQYKCIALRFMNHAGGNFKVISTMKPEGYPVTTDEYKLKTIFRHSQLRHFVIFHGADDGNKREILLDGEKTISVSPQDDCEHFADVIVTAREAPVHKEETRFSETNLPADTPASVIKDVPTDTEKAIPTNLVDSSTSSKVFFLDVLEERSEVPENKKTARQLIQDSGKKGKTLDLNEQYKDELKPTDQIPTFSEGYMNFITGSPLTKPATKKSSKSDKPTNVQDKPQTTLKENLPTTSYEEDTNITYVDEDLADNEPKLKYDPMKNEVETPPLHRNDGFGNKVKNDIKILQGKSEYSEAIKLWKNMLPLLAKYKSLNLDENDKNNEKHGRKLEKNYESKITSSKIINNQESPNSKNGMQTTAILNSQKARDTATPKQSKITLGKTISMQKNKNGTNGNLIQTTVHHTKLTNKDSTLEILNKLQESPSQNPTMTKPKVIHSKAEAIGEIFKALGSNSKIVKDANGLYLISGKHVKIIHRAYRGLGKEKIFGNNKEAKEIGPSSKENESVESFGKPVEEKAKSSEFGLKDSWASLAPVLKIHSKNPSNYQQGLSSNALSIEKKFGLDLSTYNQRDLEHKLQSDSKSEISKKLNKTAGDDPTVGLWKNGYNENSEVNNTVLPPNEKDNTNVESMDERQIQWKFNNDSFSNSTVPNEANIGVLPVKENDNLHTNVDNVNKTQSKWQFNDAYSNSSVPHLHADENQLMKNPYLSKNVQKHDSDPVNFTSKFTDDSNPTIFTETSSSVSGQSLNKSMGNGPSAGSKPSLESTLVGQGERNESKASGARVDDNFPHKIGNGNSTDFPITENINNSSNNINLSHFADSNSINKKVNSLRKKPGSFYEQINRTSIDTEDKSSSNEINPSHFTNTSGNNQEVRLQKSNAPNEKLSDVHIEVVDEAKENDNIGTDQISTDVKQDSENVEIIDEGESNQSTVKITPEDINSALQEKFGKKGFGRIGSNTNWVSGIKVPDITKATEKGATSAETTEATGKEEFISETLLENGAEPPEFEPGMNESKPRTWSDNWGSGKGTASPEFTQATGSKESKFGLRKGATPLKMSKAAERDESKSRTSGSTWSMNVLGVAGRPQESTLIRPNGLQAMNVTTDNLNSKQRTQSLQPTSGDKQVKENESFDGEDFPIIQNENRTDQPIYIGSSNKEPQRVSMSNQDEQGVTRITNVSGESMMVGKQGEHGPTRLTNVSREPMMVGKQGEHGPTRVTNVSGEPMMVSKQGEHGATRITSVSGEPMMVSKQGEQGATRITNVSSEPMIPKRIVDALLLSLTQKLQGRNSKNNQMDNQEKDKKGTFEKHKITKVDKHRSDIKTMSTAENTNLDNLLEKFVKLLSRRMKPIKTEKPKSKVKPRKKHNILSTIPVLKYQEKLLWDEQRKLEHELALEKKLLEKSMKKENMQSGKRFPMNVEDEDEVKLKKKIQQLNKEKNNLLKKFRTLSFQKKYKTGDNVHDKLMIPDQETSLTEIYASPGQKTGVGPYMGSHITYNVLNDRGINKEIGYESELKHADKQLRQQLTEYAATIGSPKGENADELNEGTPNDHEDYASTTSVPGQNVLQLLEPDTAMRLNGHSIENKKHEMVGLEKGFTDSELNSNSHEVNKGKSTNIRDFDNMPRYTADQISDGKALTAGSSMFRIQKVPHVSTEYPIYQHTPEYIHTHQTQDVAYQHTTDPIMTKSVSSNPTPSFINKEADYASDAAEKFVDPFRQSKTKDDSNFENLDQRTIKNSKSDYTESLTQGRQGVERVNDVFPGTYSYDEGHEGTQRQEDEMLLKEMPEYSAKANTIESETQPGHYTVITTQENSAAEVKPQGTNIAGSYDEVKAQVANIAGSDGNENTGVRELRTGAEGFHRPIIRQDPISKIYSQSSNILGSDVNTEGKFRPGREEMRQPNTLDGTNSKVYPQTSDIVGSSDVAREPGNELRSSLRKENGFRYENSESQQPVVNQIGDIHSNIEAGQYNMLTSRQESEVPDPQVTNTVRSENDDDDRDESRDIPENSHQPIGNEVDGAFEVVDGGEVPTLRRNTDNPEDGVQDKTYINGDEYHLQKKYGIAGKDKSKHV